MIYHKNNKSIQNIKNILVSIYNNKQINKKTKINIHIKIKIKKINNIFQLKK